MYYYLNCYSRLKLQLKRETGPRGERIASRLCRKNYSRMLTFAYRGGYAWARALYAECLFNNQETSRGMHRGAGMPGPLNQNSIASSALLERSSVAAPFFRHFMIRRQEYICPQVNSRICDEMIIRPLLFCDARKASSTLAADRWNLISRQI